MTDTGFGGGGYAFTLAAVPAAPLIDQHTAETILLAIAPDTNPPQTVYAVQNVTDSMFIDADGASSASETWQTAVEWGTVTVTGLTPSATYSFRIKARNQDGIETAYGDSTEVTTQNAGTALCPLALTITKTSSTITAPSFIQSTGMTVTIDGKDLTELGVVISSITGLESPGVVPDDELVPGDHTWMIRDEYFAPKRIVIEGHLHGVSAEDLRLRLAYLKSYLATFHGDPWRSNAPVRLARGDMPGRYWLAYYDQFEHAQPVGPAGSSSARIRIAMKCPQPFAVETDPVRVAVTPVAGSFRTLELGNAPADAVYVLTGPASNPSFTIGDAVFFCDFADGLVCTDVSGESVSGSFTPAALEAAAYRTTETGTGLLVAGEVDVSFAVPGNPTDGAWLAVISPDWQSSERTADAVILEHRADSDNFIRLYWDSTSRAWVFRKRTGGTDHEIVSPSQAFTAGTRIVLGLVYDSTNAGGMKLFIDGVLAAVGIDSTPLQAAPNTLTLHAGDGGQIPDCVFDIAAGWSRMLSADEMSRIAADPAGIVASNTTVQITAELDTGDMLTLDSRHQSAVLFDVSEGTRTNALNTITGTIPVLTPGRKRSSTDRTQTMLYTDTAVAALEIRYARRYL